MGRNSLDIGQPLLGLSFRHTAFLEIKHAPGHQSAVGLDYRQSFVSCVMVVRDTDVEKEIF